MPSGDNVWSSCKTNELGLDADVMGLLAQQILEIMSRSDAHLQRINIQLIFHLETNRD